jgi:hypothetical protein
MNYLIFLELVKNVREVKVLQCRVRKITKNISTSKLQIHAQQMYYIFSALSRPLIDSGPGEILLYALL